MTPKNIDWKMFLGTEFSLAPDMPFDREKYHQWRCYWDFGAGMFTDLFVHRTTSMLKATGLRFPGRVVGAGGIYFEYDGRDVPDVATVVADFPEGVQGLVTATMCCQETPVPQIIRGHHGSFVFGNGEEFAGYEFVAERPAGDAQQQDQETSGSKSEGLKNSSLTHFTNFVDAANGRQAGGRQLLARARRRRDGDREARLGKLPRRQSLPLRCAKRCRCTTANASWAKRWEKMSKERAAVKHIPGWNGGDTAASSTRTNTRSWPAHGSMASIRRQR